MSPPKRCPLTDVKSSGHPREDDRPQASRRVYEIQRESMPTLHISSQSPPNDLFRLPLEYQSIGFLLNLDLATSYLVDNTSERSLLLRPPCHIPFPATFFPSAS